MTRGRLVLKILTRKKSRFLFTILGIAAGIASLVTLLSLGTGLEAEVKKQSQALGAELVVTPKGWCAYEQIPCSPVKPCPKPSPMLTWRRWPVLRGLEVILSRLTG